MHQARVCADPDFFGHVSVLKSELGSEQNSIGELF